MGALSPLFLTAAVAAVVPIFLHLFHRHEARRVSFPALRYLERTEREHARSIRTRQLLLLLVRVCAILLLVGAGARLFLRGRGSAHPPTAIAIVLDNSMSSGVVLGDRRLLDDLREVALRTVSAAGDDDRIWVVRAGQPWLPATPGGTGEARRLVAATDVSEGRADLSRELARAAELVRTAGMAAAEIHLLSDLQATAFDEGAEAPAGDVPVVVFAPRDARPSNRGLSHVVLGGGLPPLEGQRSQLTVALTGTDDDTVPVPVRLVVGERVRGARSIPPGSSASLPLPPAASGWVSGYVDADPDALRADDRRYFAFRARPPPRVAVTGDPGLFTTEALRVLEDAHRLLRGIPSEADAVISESAEDLDAVRAGAAVMIVPPVDPTMLPALNRRLAAAGIPWTFARPGDGGEVRVTGEALPAPLGEVRVAHRYRLSLEGEPPGPPRTLARAGGEPWAVEGTDARGRRYLLLASPLDAESTSLPVSAGMIRFLDWATGEWAAAAGGFLEHIAGEPLPAPYGADRVRLPTGEEVAVDGTRSVIATGASGLYTFLAADSTMAVDAVNPPPAESDPTRLGRDVLDARLGRRVTQVRTPAAWEGAIFRARQGPEVWRPLLLAALFLLLLEGAVAAAGRSRHPTGRRPDNGSARGAA